MAPEVTSPVHHVERGLGGDPRDPVEPRSKGGAIAALPQTLSTFLGREGELAELAELLGCFRVVTVTGPPGVGKTRLAREFSARRSGRATFVDLARVGEPALVPRALAFALSVQEAPGRGSSDGVVAHLRGRRWLVVLDNCEHLVGACRELVERLLEDAPGLLVLATSREPLGVKGERVWPLAPLAAPDPGETPVPEALLRYPAVCLFVDRATAVDPGFALRSYVSPSVAEVCRRLDGVPLAIELAAARVDMLTPAEIASRLDARFDLLSGGSPSALERHQTLEAALDWSHDLLVERERALLRRLSVFVGGFDPEAAEGVCAGGKLKAGEVGDLLATLVSKSLLVAETGDRDQARYRLLETIRAYASDRLERTGEAAVLREGHARFYLGLAEALEPQLTGPGQTCALERIDSERENLRRALEWSLGHGHVEWSLRLAGALVLFWRVRCLFSEGKELLEAALSADDGQAPTLRAKALWGAGFMRMMAGDPQGAAPLLGQSLSLFREDGDTGGAARALLIQGNCNQALRAGSVLPLLDESAALARQAGDAWCLAHALAVAGFDHAHRGDFPAARAVLEESLAVAREAQDDQGLRIGLIALGSVAVDQGEYREAESLLQEALAIADELDEDYSRSTALQHLGRLALGRGEYDRARELLEQALELIPEVAPPNTALGLCSLLGRLSHAAGDRSGARRRYEQALAYPGGEASRVLLLWKADLTIEEGDADESRRVLEAALAQARTCDHKDWLAQALYGLGRLARDAGDGRQAAALHTQALEIQRRIGAAPGIIASIEALAGLDPAAGGYEHSARLLGAAAALRRERGYARHAWEKPGYETETAVIRKALGDEAFSAAIAAGAGLSIEAAVTEALKRAGRRGRPSSGWPSLTPKEQQVAALAAEGLSNRDMGERLCLSLGTVKTHLSHIFMKLGVAGRGELAVQVWRRRQAAADSESSGSPPQEEPPQPVARSRTGGSSLL